MPVTFPQPSPAPERAEHPRAPTLIPALRVSADQTRSQEEQAPDLSRLEPGWGSYQHTDPQAGNTNPALGMNTDTRDTGPQPAEPSTRPPSAGRIGRDQQTQ